MQSLLNYITSSINDDSISDCAKNLKTLEKLKASYPPTPTIPFMANVIKNIEITQTDKAKNFIIFFV